MDITKKKKRENLLDLNLNWEEDRELKYIVKGVD